MFKCVDVIVSSVSADQLLSFSDLFLSICHVLGNWYCLSHNDSTIIFDDDSYFEETVGNGSKSVSTRK